MFTVGHGCRDVYKFDKSVCPILDSANCAAKLCLTHSPYRSPLKDDVHQGRVLLFLNFAGFS